MMYCILHIIVLLQNIPIFEFENSFEILIGMFGYEN